MHQKPTKLQSPTGKSSTETIKDNKDYMFDCGGKVIPMNSEMGRKGQATRNMNFKEIETL